MAEYEQSILPEGLSPQEYFNWLMQQRPDLYNNLEGNPAIAGESNLSPGIGTEEMECGPGLSGPALRDKTIWTLCLIGGGALASVLFGPAAPLFSQLFAGGAIGGIIGASTPWPGGTEENNLHPETGQIYTIDK